MEEKRLSEVDVQAIRSNAEVEEFILGDEIKPTAIPPFLLCLLVLPHFATFANPHTCLMASKASSLMRTEVPTA